MAQRQTIKNLQSETEQLAERLEEWRGNKRIGSFITQNLGLSSRELTQSEYKNFVNDGFGLTSGFISLFKRKLYKKEHPEIVEEKSDEKIAEEFDAEQITKSIEDKKLEIEERTKAALAEKKLDKISQEEKMQKMWKAKVDYDISTKNNYGAMLLYFINRHDLGRDKFARNLSKRLKRKVTYGFVREVGPWIRGEKAPSDEVHTVLPEVLNIAEDYIDQFNTLASENRTKLYKHWSKIRDESETFSEYLEASIELAHMTESEFMEKLPISIFAFNAWLRGRHVPNNQTLGKIFKLLNSSDLEKERFMHLAIEQRKVIHPKWKRMVENPKRIGEAIEGKRRLLGIKAKEFVKNLNKRLKEKGDFEGYNITLDMLSNWETGNVKIKDCALLIEIIEELKMNTSEKIATLELLNTEVQNIKDKFEKRLKSAREEKPVNIGEIFAVYREIAKKSYPKVTEELNKKLKKAKINIKVGLKAISKLEKNKTNKGRKLDVRILKFITEIVNMKEKDASLVMTSVKREINKKQKDYETEIAKAVKKGDLKTIIAVSKEKNNNMSYEKLANELNNILDNDYPIRFDKTRIHMLEKGEMRADEELMSAFSIALEIDEKLVHNFLPIKTKLDKRLEKECKKGIKQAIKDKDAGAYLRNYRILKGFKNPVDLAKKVEENLLKKGIKFSPFEIARIERNFDRPTHKEKIRAIEKELLMPPEDRKMFKRLLFKLYIWEGELKEARKNKDMGVLIKSKRSIEILSQPKLTDNIMKNIGKDFKRHVITKMENHGSAPDDPRIVAELLTELTIIGNDEKIVLEGVSDKKLSDPRYGRKGLNQYFEDLYKHKILAQGKKGNENSHVSKYIESKQSTGERICSAYIFSR